MAAAAERGDVFTFADWIVACDNTRHCEAVGYAAAGGASRPAAFWVARDAGPAAR